MNPLIIAIAIAAAPRVAIVMHTTGFSDEDARRITDKAHGEVKATGIELGPLPDALEVKPECLEERECAAEVARTAGATFIVSIKVLRAGGQAALSAALIDADGRVSAEHQVVRRLELLMGDDALLAEDIAQQLRDAVGSSPPPPTSPVDEHNATAAAPEPLAPSAAEPPIEPEQSQQLSPLAMGGVVALGAGALAAVAGSAVVAAQLGVLDDPSSLREEKEQAALVLIPALGAVAIVGVAVAGAGGVLLWLGLDEG